MKVIGYTALHYGADYLGYAIRSIIDDIDEYYVLYCTEGSHGHRVEARCPETREELHVIAQQAAGDKLRWFEGDWTAEHAQRGAIQKMVDADVFVVLDADEIWPAGALAGVRHIPELGARNILVPMVHYWRSFYRCVTEDPSLPVRMICPQYLSGDFIASAQPKIHHFGYAQSPEIVGYKWKIHGHRPELRTDVNWFQDVFMANRQTDCHPTNVDFWNPQVVDPFEIGLPEFMREHKWAGVEVIKQ